MIILKDIAQMAGVNISTVSRALNDSNEVSDEKKQEIRNIAASLNYTPIMQKHLQEKKQKLSVLLFRR